MGRKKTATGRKPEKGGSRALISKKRKRGRDERHVGSARSVG